MCYLEMSISIGYLELSHFENYGELQGKPHGVAMVYQDPSVGYAPRFAPGANPPYR